MIIPTIIITMIVAAITLSVGARFLVHDDDPRCSYRGGSPLWKIITTIAASTVVGILFTGVL